MTALLLTFALSTAQLNSVPAPSGPVKPAPDAALSDTIPVASQTEPARPAIFSFYAENDVLAVVDSSTDRYYTNGVQAVWLRFGARSDDSVGSVWRPNRACDPKNPPGANPCGVQLLGIGQTMHTPASIESIYVDPTDRPYAGWLYAMGSAMSVWAPPITGKFARRLDDVYARGWHTLSADAQVGIFGPAAGSRTTQSMAHWWWSAGSRLPVGWDGQLKHQPGINLGLRYAFTARWETERNRLAAELTPLSTLQAGTVMNAARAGIRARVGFRMAPEFGIGNMLVTSPGGDNKASDPLACCSLSFSYELQGRVVAWNSFVQGGLADHEWRRVSEIELERIGTERFVGATLGLGSRVNITYRTVRRSPEHRVKAAAAKPEDHHFGIFILTIAAS